MYMSNQSKPGRQTMMNVKPTDHVPFEHVIRASVLQSTGTVKVPSQNSLPV
jgi:hypothetical protein